MKLFPPFAVSAALWLLRPVAGFTGNYKSWEDALADSKTYEDPNIVEMYQSQVRIPPPPAESELSQREIRLAAAIYRVSAELGRNHPINVLDVGGAYGGHRALFDRLGVAVGRYEIQESPAVVQALENFSDERRSWVHQPTLNQYDLILCSGTIQVLEDALERVKAWSSLTTFLILDRTPVFNELKTRIVRQNVILPRLKRTSYPGYFFGQGHLNSVLEDFGTVFLQWRVPEDSPIVDLRRRPYSGFLVRFDR